MSKKHTRQEDRALVSRILSGDKKALRTFYHEYSPALSRFVHARVSGSHDAEELLQDTLFAFLDALRDFDGRSSVKTFLYTICRNKIVDYYRRKKIKHIVFSQMPQLSVLVSPLLTPEEAFDAQVLSQKIERAFRAILPRYRTILRMKYIEGRPVDVIASELSITFKSAESRLFRARKAFVYAYSHL